MEITICNQCGEERWDECRADFEAVLRRTAERTQMQEDACVSVIFVTPEQIHAINRDYRGIDRPTDVISFALHDTMEEYEMPGGEEAEAAIAAVETRLSPETVKRAGGQGAGRGVRAFSAPRGLLLVHARLAASAWL